MCLNVFECVCLFVVRVLDCVWMCVSVYVLCV